MTSPALREHLVAAALAGAVQTTPAQVLANIDRLLAGDPEYTFGLSDWRDASRDEVVGAVAALCGAAATQRDHSGAGYIDPDATVTAVAEHRRRIAEFVAAGGGRVLLATGHPTGLLPHYAAIARALARAGCELLRPLDDTFLPGERRGLRFLDGVACLWSGGDLHHTHRSTYMEAMLDALEADSGQPDLVLGDHGMAGAAIERGLEVLSIADVNDPALPLAQARGHTTGVLPIDDNLAPARFVPVTDAVTAGLR